MQQQGTFGRAELRGPAVERNFPHGLPGLIRAISTAHPTAVATSDEAGALSYHELELRSDAVARALRESVTSGLPVVLAIPRSTALLTALLGALKAGVPYLPVDPFDPPARIRQVIEVSGSSTALVTPLTQRILADQGLRTLDVTALTTDLPDGEPEGLAEVSADQPVYVLFTSGSTGAPKGVVLPSDALCNRLVWMRDTYQVGPSDRIMQKTPVTFDVSGWELFLPLISGARCIFLAPDEHRDPVQVARAVVKNHITVCHFVPSMLREFLRWPDAARCTSLRHVFCSGEALPVEVARQFVSTLQARLHNLYGPTEAAIDVTHWSCPPVAEEIQQIFIGRPVDNCVLAVLAEDRTPVPAGQEGELHIGGVPLALGYLNRPDLTAKAFGPAPEGSSVPRLYRTGDRVRLVDGEIEYLGRIDDQVKIRGQRIEPREIEHHLTARPEVAAAVVVAARLAGEQQLVAWIRPSGRDPEPTADAGPLSALLRDHLTGLVPPAYLPFRFLLLGEIPLTSSGKQDRKLLRQEAEKRLAAQPPTPSSSAPGGLTPSLLERLRQEQGKKAGPSARSTADVVGGIWAGLLPGSQAEDQDTFLSLGGHSLLAAHLAAEVYEKLGVRIAPGHLLRHNPTLSQFQQAVDGAARDDVPEELTEVPEGPVPAAPGQHRLWLLSRLFPDSPAYNVVGALRIAQHLRAEALSVAVAAVTARQSALRSSLRDAGTLLLDTDHDAAPVVTVGSGDPDEITEFLVRRRDIGLDPRRSPLFEVAALNVSDGTAVLVATFHHAIADQRSLEVFMDELSAEYARLTGGTADHERPLPPGGDYRQYAAQQHRRRATDGEKALTYWKRALADAPPATDLPFGHPPLAVPSFRGAAVAATLGDDTDQALRAFSVRSGCTPAVVLLTAAAVAMARWTTSKDVVIGVAAADRDRAEFQRTIGFFVDTVPVRLDLTDRPTLAVALGRVREALAGGREHSAVPFDELAAALRPDREPDVNPVFQTWFNDLSEASAPARFAGSQARPEELPVGWSLFDLGFYLHRDQGRYRLQVVHAVDRYDTEVATALLDQWHAAVRAMAEDASQAVTGFGAGQEPEPALPAAPGPSVRDLVEKVLAHAVRAPQATALLTSAGQRHSYAWLSGAVLSCAAALDRLLPAGRPVAVSARRHPLLPVSLLGCWLSGRPVLLLDAEAPAEWQQHGVRHIDAAAVLTLDGTPAALDLPELRLSELLDEPAGTAPRTGVPAFGHALLTSGTTGTPSVVTAPSDALPTAFAWYAGELGLTEHDVFCSLAGAGHDPVLREMLLPLTLGATVLVPSAAERFDPVRLHHVLREQRCTVVNLTPGHAQLLAAAAGTLPDVRRVGFYGALLNDATARALRGVMPAAELYNVYGTTETPQASSAYRWHDPAGEESSWRTARPSVPVGHGTSYRSLTVVTSDGRRAAVGQLGEVVVAGAGLAQGTGGSYRTGDLGRYTPDGEVEIHSRIDRQLSVRGHRVEPATVESVLTRAEGVLEAVVGPYPGRADSLIAWVVPAAGRPSPERLQRRIRSLLPSWSVPEDIILVDKIPLTRHGKPDIGALPTSPAAPPRPAPRPAAKRNEVREGSALQERLAAAVLDISGHAPGADQHFFEAGLTSLDILRLHQRLVELLAVEFPVVDLFQFPTLRSLAAHLATPEASRSPAPGGGARTELQARRAARQLPR